MFNWRTRQGPVQATGATQMTSLSIHKRPRPHFPLNRLLRLKGRSQYSLAAQTRISQTYINRIARGKALPSWKMCVVLAEALGLSLGDFCPDPTVD